MPKITKTGFKWRMQAPCEFCPFGTDASADQMRESLRPERVKAIQADLLAGRHFICHKTTSASGKQKKDNMVCAGAITWQAERGVVADLVQVMERLDKIREREEA